MLKWLIITVVAVLIFTLVLLGLGYLLKEHEVATKQLKLELDQQRVEQVARDKRKQLKFKPANEVSLIQIVSNSNEISTKNSKSIKQKVLIENLTCVSAKQCVLVDIQFADLSCTFAVNTIGASLLTKVVDELNTVEKCPDYPKNSQLSCQSNLCSYGSINN
jgi:hypothetical protein